MAGESNYSQTGRLYSNSEVVVLGSLMKAKGEADEARRADMAERLDVFRDDWKDILLARLRDQFEVENYEEIRKVVDVSNNPLKRIVEDLSTIYHKPAVWEFEAKGAGDLWGKILEDARAKVLFPALNQYVNLCNEVFVLVAPHGAGLKFHLITPDNLLVWQDPDDPTKPIAIAYRSGMAQTRNAKPKWVFWSAYPDNPVHEILEGDDFDKATILLREDNPYKDKAGKPVLPGALYHRSLPVDSPLDPTSGNDLFEATILVGCLETWINHLMRTDSTQLKYATGLLESKGVQVAGTTRILTFTNPSGAEGVNVGQFSSQGDWMGLGAHIARKLQNVLNNNGMSMSDFQLSGDAQSGFALTVRKEGLLERREKQIPLYECWDKDLYAAACAVWNFELRNTESDITGEPLPWPEDARPKVSYAAYQRPLTVQERKEELELVKARVGLGFESILSAFMDEHPGMTEEEAREMLLENKQINQELGAGSLGNQPAGVAAGGGPAPTPSLVERLRAQRMAERQPQQQPEEAAE